MSRTDQVGQFVNILESVAFERNFKMARNRNFNGYYNYESEEQLLTFVSHIQANTKWSIGQREMTEAGQFHFQFVCGFSGAKTLANAMKTLNNFTLQATQNTAAMVMYCTDEKKRIVNTEVITAGEIPVRYGKAREEIIKTACQLSNFNEAMKYIEDKDIEYYVQHKGQLTRYFSEKFDQADTVNYSINEFNIKAIPIPANKALLFIGATGIGKTQFALAHFKSPIKITNNEDYGRIGSDTDGIILDDLNFSQWSAMTMLHLCDVESPYTMNIKYGSARIPAGMKRIFIVNDEELFWPKDIHPETKKAIERRIVRHTFYSNLFDKNKKKKPNTPPPSPVTFNPTAEEVLNFPTYMYEAFSAPTNEIDDDFVNQFINQ